jgi:hypothetical protein
METPQPMSHRAAGALGLSLALLALSALACILAFWPAGSVTGRTDTVPVLFGARSLPRETDLLLLALLFGCLGSFLHLAKSFATFAGNRTLIASWTWWYCLQPLVGMGLALIFYVAVRGGLLASAASAADVSPYGIAGVSGLVGMFSKQATDKLNELFTTLFQTAADASRTDKS